MKVVKIDYCVIDSYLGHWALLEHTQVGEPVPVAAVGVE